MDSLEAAASKPAGPLPSRFLFHINFVLASTLITNTVGFLVAIMLARALGPDGRGIAAIYTSAVGLGYAFLNFGIGSAAFYFVSRREISGRQAMEAGLTVALVAAVLTTIGVGVVSVIDVGLAHRGIPYALTIFTIPASIQLRVISAILRTDGRFGAMNLLEMVLPVALLVILGGIEVTRGLTVSTAVWGFSLAHVPTLLVGFGLVGRRYWPRALAPLSMLRKTIRFGSQEAVGNLIELAKYRLDIFLILAFVNTAGVGLYTVSSSQTEGLWVVADSISIVLLTNITAGDEKNSARLTPVVCRNTLLITAISAAVAAVIAGLWIPAVFGGDYQASVVPYLWLLPGTVALSGSKILASYVFSRGRPIVNAWISLATLVVSIPTLSVLIHFFGVPGAAIGTSVSYCLDLCLSAYAYHRLSGEPANEAIVPRPADVRIYTEGLKTAYRWLRRMPQVASGVEETAADGI